ncbi:MAG: Ig-like domain-containing protein, partial [Planctomycetota bacterium]|nr:Ig-like domain-containing protein [Planctomycetota bacterium]
FGGVAAIAGGGEHSLALKTDSTVWAWGDNYYGQLGDGTAWRQTPGPVLVPSTVTNVSSTSPNGFYGVGRVIAVTVTFNDPVNVTGTPQLTLETGTTDAVLNYSSGSGTNTLTFSYTVAAGHASPDLDYVATTSLALNGGTIRYGTTLDAILTLPSPGAAGSLGANKDIVVETIPPTISDIADQTINEDASTDALAFSIGDNLTPADTLTLDKDSSNTTLVPLTNVVFGGSETDRTITVTPAADATGTATITVTVTDQAGNSASDTFLMTVNAVNDAPSFTKGADQTVNEDAGAKTVTGWATAISPWPADESGQAVDFIVTNDNNGLFSSQPAVSPAGTLTYTPAANANGSATVTVRIHDNGGGADTSATQTFTITVNAVNDAPSFTKGADQTVNEDAGAKTVTGWATAISPGPADESGQAVDFIVTNDNNGLFSSQPAVSPAGTLTYTPAANANGVATVTVQLHDDGGTANGGADTSAAQTLTITVNAVNDAPTINSAPVASANPVQAGSPVSFTVSATDVDGGTLSYTWDFGDGTIVTTTESSVTHPFAAPGKYAVKVTITGSAGLSSSSTMNVEVVAAPNPPDDDICAGLSKVPLRVQQIAAKLRFPSSISKDALSLKALLPLNDGFNPDGQVVQWDIGGIRGETTLNAKGGWPVSKSVKVSLKYKKPVKGQPFTARTGKLAISIKNVALDQLVLSGIATLNATSASTKGDPATIQACVVLKGHQAYHTTGYAGVYKAKKDKGGAFKAQFKL